jgi:hypothetical protein
MEAVIDVPPPIRKNVAKRLQKSGALKRIERKIKLGMMVAAEEIREDAFAPSHLEHQKFKNASPYELQALQAVSKFLSSRNLTYTLSVLVEESAVRLQGDAVNIIDLVRLRLQRPPGRSWPIEEEEEEEEGADERLTTQPESQNQKGWPEARAPLTGTRSLRH